MKHLKLFEDIEWEFDDEEINNELKIGDKVLLKEDVKKFEKIDNYLDRHYYFDHRKYDITSFGVNTYKFKKQIITDIKIRDDDELVFMLKGKWPWFVAKYWKKV